MSPDLGIESTCRYKKLVSKTKLRFKRRTLVLKLMEKETDNRKLIQKAFSTQIGFFDSSSKRYTIATKLESTFNGNNIAGARSFNRPPFTHFNVNGFADSNDNFDEIYKDATINKK